MEISYANCPEPKPFSTAVLPEPPLFLSYEPDWTHLSEVVSKTAAYKNLILVANGGSSNPFLGLYNVLKSQSTKRVFFVTTVDPDYLADLRAFCAPAETLVLSVSKSGTNVAQLEATQTLSDYPVIALTEPGTPLEQLAATQGWQVVRHPPIGGRYTGFTEVALLPAAICGLNVRAVWNAARALFSSYRTKNQAWDAASIFYQLEQSGYVDVLVHAYSHRLAPFGGIIAQLCHESFGKAGLGQTYFTHEAPEVQHHTSQRFFGGRKNIAGWFLTAARHEHDAAYRFPESTHGIAIRGARLGDIDGTNLSDALRFEHEGVRTVAADRGIPLVHQELAALSPEAAGELLAFWQLYAVYASVLRGVDPFDQPEVEAFKSLSFQLRLGRRAAR